MSSGESAKADSPLIWIAITLDQSSSESMENGVLSFSIAQCTSIVPFSQMRSGPEAQN